MCWDNYCEGCSILSTHTVHVATGVTRPSVVGAAGRVFDRALTLARATATASHGVEGRVEADRATSQYGSYFEE